MTRERHRPRAGVRALLILVVIAPIAAAACTSQRVAPPPGGAMAGMAPMLSVERFLQAANTRDFAAMRRLFGTHEGPIQGDPQDIELRMAAIAQVLRHDDYQVVGQRDQPGRIHATTRVGVTLTIGGRVIPDVPFLVVRTADGQWLVEEVDLERIMRG